MATAAFAVPGATFELWCYDANGQAVCHAAASITPQQANAMCMSEAQNLADHANLWVDDASTLPAVWMDLYVGGKLVAGCDL